MMSEEKETQDPSREAGFSEESKETGPETETQERRGDADAAESGSGEFDDEVQELKDKYLRLFAEFDN
jgi:molecular chaperone GrpE (heat shock protein)